MFGLKMLETWVDNLNPGATRVVVVVCKRVVRVLK